MEACADEGDNVARASAAAEQRHLTHEDILLLWGLVLEPLDGNWGHAVGAAKNHPESTPPKLHLGAIIIEEYLQGWAIVTWA